MDMIINHHDLGAGSQLGKLDLHNICTRVCYQHNYLNSIEFHYMYNESNYTRYGCVAVFRIKPKTKPNDNRKS